MTVEPAAGAALERWPSFTGVMVAPPEPGDRGNDLEEILHHFRTLTVFV
jgi:hypothetical protein